jgi:phenylacetate-CoA ligase
MPLRRAFYRHLLYYPVARWQAGDLQKHQRFLDQSQYGTRTDLDSLQAERLNRLLDHARRHVPFYQDGVLPAGPQVDLSGLPFLLKSDLQASGPRLRSTAALGRLVTKTTGGSTGQPVTLVKSREALAWELAATWRGYSWAGVGAGDRQARFWGVPHDRGSQRKARLIDAVCNRVRLSAFHFGEQDLERYVGFLNQAKPRYFYGYVSMIAEFAKFLRRKNLKLDLPLECIITTAEVLTDADRQLLTETFGAPVFNEYGCGELGTVAHECEHGSLHLSEENMIVEIMSGEKSCAEGQAGELVVTELNNLSFPLIRYRTGDYGSIGADRCRCGRTLRVLESVQGRAYDFIRNRHGTSFHGEFIMYIFEDLRRQGAKIRQFQVIQQGVDAFLVRIVPDLDYDSTCEEVIARRIREQVDMASTVKFEYIETVEREKSGKLRLIKGLE